MAFDHDPHLGMIVQVSYNLVDDWKTLRLDGCFPDIEIDAVDINKSFRIQIL